MEIIHHHNFKGGFCSKHVNKYSAVFTGLKGFVMYIINILNPIYLSSMFSLNNNQPF